MITAVHIPYDIERARNLASAISQIVPVLLLAALAVPVLQRRQPPVQTSRADTLTRRERNRAARHLWATIAVLATSLLTEYIALYGVYDHLNERDVGVLTTLFFLTFIAAGVRVLQPIIEHYSDLLDRGEWVLWLAIAAGTVILAGASLKWLGS